MGALFTNAGLALFAQHHAAGTGLTINKIKFGNLPASQIDNAVASDTALTDHSG